MDAGVVTGAELDQDRFVRQYFLGALMLRVVQEGDGLGALDDLGGHVVRSPGGGAPCPGQHVAVGIVGIRRVSHTIDAAGDAAHGMRADAAGAADVVVVGTYACFAGEVADVVIGEVADGVDRTTGGRGGDDAVQGVVVKGFGQAVIGVDAGFKVADGVIQRVAHVLHGIASTGVLVGEAAGGRIVDLGGDHAVAVGLLGQVSHRIHAVGGPVDGGGRCGIHHLGEVAHGVVVVLGGKAGGVGLGVRTAIRIVGGGGDVGFGRGVDHGAGDTWASQCVVAVGAAVAVVGGGGGQFAFAFYRGVIGPGGGQAHFGAAGQAAEFVIHHGGGLRFGIDLADEFAQRIVGVGPAAHVGVFQGELAATGVVG